MGGDPTRPRHAGPGLATGFGVLLTCVVLCASVAVRAGMPHGLRELEAEKAPPLALRDLAQREHTLDDYRGSVLVVNFWSTWCLPCREELPGMARAARVLVADGIRIVTVAMGQGHDEVAAYAEEFPFDLPKLLDPLGRVAEAWRVQVLPTTYVVDPQGRRVLQVTGAYDWESPELWARLRALAR